MTTAEFWPQFWPQFWSALVSGVVLGIVFTLGWGLISGRRDALGRQIDLVTAWADEYHSSALAWFQATRAIFQHRENLLKVGGERLDHVVARFDELGQKAYVGWTRMSHLTNAVQIFDSPEVNTQTTRTAEAMLATQNTLALIVPLEATAGPALEQADERLRESMSAAQRLLTIMLREASLGGIIRYYRHYLRRHYNAE